MTLTQQDTNTPYITLPIVFENAYARAFTVPLSVLAAGAYYEFRLGFPFPTYTSYTDTIVAKTFDSSSPFINSVVTSSTNSSISVSWGAPEYSDGAVGYSVRIYYKVIGNGNGKSRHWDVSQVTLAASLSFGLSQTSFSFGCDSGSNVDCLSPFTVYRVDISVIRQSGAGSPVSVYVTTAKTVVPVVAKSTAVMFLFGKKITVTLVDTVPNYPANTPISSSILYPFALKSIHGELNYQLKNSSMQTTGNHTIVVTMSEAEFTDIVNELFGTLTFSVISMFYGASNTAIPLQHHCLR